MLDSAHITAGDMSGDITPTVPVSLAEIVTGSLHAVWTGTPTGTFILEGTNFNDQGGTPSDWTDISDLLDPVMDAPAGAAGSMYINLDVIGAKWVRLRYDATSGAGTLKVWAFGKTR